MVETPSFPEQYAQANKLKQGFDSIYEDILSKLLGEYGSVNPTVDFTANELKKMVEDLFFIKSKVDKYRENKILDSNSLSFLYSQINKAEISRDNLLIITLLETIKQLESGTMFHGLMLQ